MPPKRKRRHGKGSRREHQKPKADKADKADKETSSGPSTGSTTPSPPRMPDGEFVRDSIVLIGHQFGESWHKYKEIQQHFPSTPAKSVMFPVSSDDLEIDNIYFSGAAVLTFAPKDVASVRKRYSEQKVIAFPEGKQMLSLCHVILAMSTSTASAGSEALLRERIDGSQCARVLEVLPQGILIEVYKFQLKSLEALIKGTSFGIQSTSDAAVTEGDEGPTSQESRVPNGACAADPSSTSKHSATEAQKQREQCDLDERGHQMTSTGAASPTTKGGGATPQASTDETTKALSGASELGKHREGTGEGEDESRQDDTQEPDGAPKETTPDVSIYSETKGREGKDRDEDTSDPRGDAQTPSATSTDSAPQMSKGGDKQDDSKLTSLAPAKTSAGSWRERTDRRADSKRPHSVPDKPSASSATDSSEPQASATASLGRPKRTRVLAAPEHSSFRSKSSSLVVHVLVYDITTLEVDAVVNAANIHLKHGGGVAYAIANAAGRRLTDECKTHIKDHGPLTVTSNIVTTGGNLPAKNVIHAVGPSMQYYRSAEQCKIDVHKTFDNVIATAKRCNFVSIAVPAISSGIYGVPTDTVAEAMVDMVTKLATTRTSLREIYLVDIGPGVIHLVLQAMARRSDFEARAFSGLRSAESSCSSATKTGKTPGSSAPKTGKTSGSSAPKTAKTPGISAPKTAKTSGSSAPKTAKTSGSPAPKTAKTPRDDDATGLFSEPAADYDDDCSICMDKAEDPVALSCGHVFCRECINTAFSHKPVCPMCGAVMGTVQGDQPTTGTMCHRTDTRSLEGYEHCGTIVINYDFPNGYQGEEHPRPGHPYRGTRREAYLPDNGEGRTVLDLLTKAFDQRLIFTVGQSRTTGKGDTVTWNDIHHKTSVRGGPQRFGYPDPTYLSRVQEELAAKGIK